MKKFWKYCTIALMVLSMASCGEKEEPIVESYLEVTPNNIAGSWKLSSWKGEDLPEGLFFYIDLVRRDGLFTTYENMSSFSVHKESGYYKITTDESLGAIIRGMRDNSMGSEWNHRYIVTELTSDRMVWTVTDDPEDVSVFVRCEIPADIKGE